MKLFFCITSIFMIAGCSSNAYPTLYAGKYYMMGDSDCKYVYRQVSNTRIICMDGNKNNTGYRDAMTYDDILMYKSQVDLYNAQMTSLSNTLNQVGQSLDSSSQPTYQYIPVEQPSFSYGSSKTTYRRVGNTILGSDGSKCQIVGSSVICD